MAFLQKYTPEGSYVILGSSVVGNTKKFWELFAQRFKVEIVTPQRNDAEVSGFELQINASGPIVSITEATA